MRKFEPIIMLQSESWVSLVCLLLLAISGFVMVVWLFLAVPSVCLQFVIVLFHDYTHLLFLLFSKKFSQFNSAIRMALCLVAVFFGPNCLQRLLAYLSVQQSNIITPSMFVCLFVCLFCCFTSQVNSYYMVMAGLSVHRTTTLFYWASLNKQLTSTLSTYFCL